MMRSNFLSINSIDLVESGLYGGDEGYTDRVNYLERVSYTHKHKRNKSRGIVLFPAPSYYPLEFEAESPVRLC